MHACLQKISIARRTQWWMSKQNWMIKKWDDKKKDYKMHIQHFKAAMEFKNCDSNAEIKVKPSEAATGGVL